MKTLVVIFASLTLAACATRAPSTYELDKKAGLMPALDVDVAKKDAKSLRTIEEKSEKESRRERALRSQPRVERIWVYGQELSPSAYLDGTHVFLEVSPAEWARQEGVSK